MDLVETLEEKIDVLPDGPYLHGLRAILLHIETAFKHLMRGRSEGEDTAFTDAIYRANQAFEGSAKEAYRVLAEKNPDLTTPAQIEKYLEEKKVFRPRVLAQFTNYRREWRNPSTHDYKLDFDESEAFLAIVSVTAFALLLLSEIEERLSFNATRQSLKSDGTLSRVGARDPNHPLRSIRDVLVQFLESSGSLNDDESPAIEAQIIGALAAYLVSAYPDADIQRGVPIGDEAIADVDLMMISDARKYIFELRRTKRVDGSLKLASVSLMERYAEWARADFGIVIIVGPAGSRYRGERVSLGSFARQGLLVRPDDGTPVDEPWPL